MKLGNKLTAGLLGLAVSALTANACHVVVRVACPSDVTASGIKVCIDGVGCDYTDGLGVVEIDVPWIGETYTVCVDPTTLPPGANLNKLCQQIKVNDPAPPVVDFTLKGSFCNDTPPPGPCWLTGGGTVYKGQGVPPYSFGGVVYPGCSPKAADGGNWNVVDHVNGLHFQGQQIIVDSCSGVATKSPKVTVNIIDFHGTGIISGIAGNSTPTTPVTFVGRAVDNKDGGSNSDLLYIKVNDGPTTVLQVGNSVADPAVITTGNLQIHQTSCGN